MNGPILSRAGGVPPESPDEAPEHVVEPSGASAELALTVPGGPKNEAPDLSKEAGGRQVEMPGVEPGSERRYSPGVYRRSQQTQGLCRPDMAH